MSGLLDAMDRWLLAGNALREDPPPPPAPRLPFISVDILDRAGLAEVEMRELEPGALVTAYVGEW